MTGCFSPDSEEDLGKYANRLPPGQRLAKTLPVLHFGPEPVIDVDTWRLRVFGLVNTETEISYQELLAFPQVDLTADVHCVTRWSKLDTHWQGVRLRDLLERAGIKSEAHFVLLHAAKNYTTAVPLEAALADDSIIAHTYDGKPLERKHGGPVRAIISPHDKYFWKSAKWVTGIELLAKDRLGFWERQGYNNDANPWKEERYSES